MMYACSWKGVGVPEVVVPSALSCAQLTVGKFPSHRTPFATRAARFTKGISAITEPLSISENVIACTSGSRLIMAYCAMFSALAETVMVRSSFWGLGAGRWGLGLAYDPQPPAPSPLLLE